MYKNLPFWFWIKRVLFNGRHVDLFGCILKEQIFLLQSLLWTHPWVGSSGEQTVISLSWTSYP